MASVILYFFSFIIDFTNYLPDTCQKKEALAFQIFNFKHPVESEVTEDVLNTSVSVSSKTVLKTHICRVLTLLLFHQTHQNTTCFQNTSLEMWRFKKIKPVLADYIPAQVMLHLRIQNALRHKMPDSLSFLQLWNRYLIWEHTGAHIHLFPMHIKV